MTGLDLLNILLATAGVAIGATKRNWSAALWAASCLVASLHVVLLR